jgi:hypothetical protein
MLTSGTWLYITFGTALGIVTLIFAYRIAKTPRTDKINIGSLILYTFSVCFIAYLYATATSGGLLVEWQLLGFPSFSDRASKILEIGYIQAQSGNIYHWTNPYSRLDGQWEKVDEIKTDPSFPIFPSCDSGSLSFLPMKRDNFIDFKEACIYLGPGPSKTAYAIDDSGQVYLWFHGVGEYGGIERIIHTVVWGTYSCGFGIFLILLFAGVNFFKRKFRSQNQMEKI